MTWPVRLAWTVRLAVLLASLALFGCTGFKGVKPIYPGVGNPKYPTVVDSLAPTFEWQAQPDAESYDFIIYEGIKTGGTFWEPAKRAVGREIYYREALQSTKHQVEEPLKPDMEYYWSVRSRRGSQISPWSLYDYDLFLGAAYTYARNQPFIFKTPNASRITEPKPGQ